MASNSAGMFDRVRELVRTQLIERALPEPMNPRVRRRIEDAFAGRSGILHVFEAGD